MSFAVVSWDFSVCHSRSSSKKQKDEKLLFYFSFYLFIFFFLLKSRTLSFILKDNLKYSFGRGIILEMCPVFKPE